MRLWLFVVLAGCDPGFVLEGSVLDAGGRPVQGAKVRVNCAGDMQAETVSDTQGRFRGNDIGWYPESCVVEVFPPGQTTALSWPMMPWCTKRRGEHACLTVAAHIRLP